ncbi:unnamed protein product [Rhodiola kirilowii]
MPFPAARRRKSPLLSFTLSVQQAPSRFVSIFFEADHFFPNGFSADDSVEMELRSRRKLSTNPIVNGSGYKSSSSSDDEKDDSISRSDNSDDSVSSSGDTLISDGQFESDKDSDVEILSGKREVVVNDGEADGCAIDDKKRMNIGSNKKTTGAGGTSEAVENDDVVRNVGNEAGLQGMPLADDNNSDPPGEDDIVPNIPPKNVDPPAKKRKRGPWMWQILEMEIWDWLEENIDEDTDLVNLNEKINEIAEAPSDLTMPLLRYQKEWLAWALKKEASEARGGILADEMGMGKTIQAIALVLAKRERSRAASHFTESSLPAPSSTGLPEVKGTLVICPPVALTHWESEIIRFTAKGSTKVLIYHGASRGKTVRQLTECDFVLTTYAIVETEYRRNSISKTHVEELSPRPRFKNFNKTPEGSKVDSTQHTSSMENGAFSQQSESKMPLILHSLKWERIILDEAHYIKDRKLNTAQAVFALESSFKWALSGTPLQNRVGELYSLIRFLRINPYSYYFCRHCDCKILEYRPSRDCKSCTHPPYTHFFWWNKYVAKPIRTQGCSGEGKNAMNLLKNKILKDIMLRRAKKGRAADLALPPKMVSLRRDSMNITEEDYYTSLYKGSRAEFNTYIQQGRLRNDYANMFGFLTRLQKAANHLYLVEYSKPKQTCCTCFITVKEAVVPWITCLIQTEAVIYSMTISKDWNEKLKVNPCDHVFCNTCWTMWTSDGSTICPKCYDMSASSSNQKEINSVRRYRESSILDRIQLEDFQTSTKIDALKEEIRFMLERDGSAKGLVFSQFPSFLDLICYSLGKSGISSVQLVGSMTMSDKDSAIKKFNEDPACKIFLISLKAGGIALNLTVASHVFLMEPCWNPAVELQAVDRVHRIGQGKPTRIVRFVIENTIEERLLKIQEKKDLAFDGIMGGGSSEGLSKLTMDDLRFLFTYS